MQLDGHAREAKGKRRGERRCGNIFFDVPQRKSNFNWKPMRLKLTDDVVNGILVSGFLNPPLGK